MFWVNFIFLNFIVNKNIKHKFHFIDNSDFSYKFFITSGKLVPVHRSLGGSYWREHVAAAANVADTITAAADLDCAVLLEMGMGGRSLLAEGPAVSVCGGADWISAVVHL